MVQAVLNEDESFEVSRIFMHLLVKLTQSSAFLPCKKPYKKRYMIL